jgi:hypothetical protein
MVSAVETDRYQPLFDFFGALRREKSGDEQSGRKQVLQVSHANHKQGFSVS